jgi:para-aminobenzoate synthetase component 1
MQKTKVMPEWVLTMNDLGKEKVPFFFLIDFEMKKVVVLPFLDLDSVLFNFNGITNLRFNRENSSEHFNKKEHVWAIKDFSFDKFPMSFMQYTGQFMSVLQHIKYGNSFLVNLTHKTPVTTSLSLEEIYYATSAKYKLKYKDEFVIFSPESFVKIDDQGVISTYPMKGTIDASLPDAAQRLINDEKELAEHHTIVDLLRNDLSRVAKNVRVSQFRYLEMLITNQKALLQASSRIEGNLPGDWMDNIGSILNELLPAGSISGAPKDKTCSIIAEVEDQDRGYYTGVTGMFDGVTLDSGVAIRYIEKDEDGLWFRSGCGITSQSNVKSEYEEMIDKIYVPIG